MNTNQPWEVLRFKGTGSWDSIAGGDDKAVVDNGTFPYTVKLETGANHNLTIGSHITIAGTTNYNGTFEVLALSATKYIYIAHKYIEEDITTSATFKLTLAPGVPFEFGGFRLHLGSGGAAASLTVTLDSGAGSVYDTILFTYAMSALTNLIWLPPNIVISAGAAVANYHGGFVPYQFDKDDEIDFAYANTQTYGLEVLWRRI